MLYIEPISNPKKVVTGNFIVICCQKQNKTKKNHIGLLNSWNSLDRCKIGFHARDMFVLEKLEGEL